MMSPPIVQVTNNFDGLKYCGILANTKAQIAEMLTMKLKLLVIIKLWNIFNVKSKNKNNNPDFHLFNPEQKYPHQTQGQR